MVKKFAEARRVTLENLSADMGHDKSWLSGAGKRGRMAASDFKLLCIMLDATEEQLIFKEKEQVDNGDANIQVVIDKLASLEATIAELTKEVSELNKPKFIKPPKSEGQKMAERILVQTMAGSRYCRYDTYIANCELQGIEAVDTTKAWKSCHCELKKKGYGINQSNWLVVLDGYELPKISD